jgi:lysyl-tRNA synthetase class 2
MGKASFLDISDSMGRIQVYIKIDGVGEDVYAQFRKWDIGDIIGISGEAFRTRRGEISVKAEKLVLLSKSLLPLPEKWHGLKDTDLRYRQRYVDLIVNPEVRDTFVRRSQIITAIREFLTNEGFLEVDTPVLHTLETGAAARPFETHLNALDLHMFLRIELELYLKRLIVGGLDKVFELGRIFRNEGMDVKHNPEFTMCEFYQAYTDYYGMMDLIERLFAYVATKVLGTMTFMYQGEELDLTPPWRRMTMVEAVREFLGVDYDSWADDAQARAAVKSFGLPCEDSFTKGDCLAALFDEKCEDFLVQPTIVMDYPVEISPLAKRKKDNPDFTERFEFFIFRREGGNAFSELNDPIDQRARFENQLAVRRAQGVTTAELDEDFLTAMEYGMPPTGGLGFGVDRLVMLLTDSYSIRDVLLFPTMKPIKE